MSFFAASEAPPRPESMKFPVFSLLAGNLAFSETSSQLTPPSSGESVSRRTLSSGVKNPGFPRGFRGCVFGTVGREPQGRKHRADPQQYLCRAIFQYRISSDAVATSCWVKVARRVPKRDRASGLRDASGS